MATVIVHADGTVESYDETDKKAVIARFKAGCDVEVALVALGYESEKFVDPSSGVLTLRLIPPLAHKTSQKSIPPR